MVTFLCNFHYFKLLKMNKKGIVILLAAIFCTISAMAQGRKGLVFNEVMVQNDSNCMDAYGKRHAWIELFNSTRASMQISNVYVTNDKNVPTKYGVPRGDHNTKLGPLQHVLFFADNDPGKGTFHLSFDLTPGVDNHIYLFDADGKTLIDEVVVPASLPANCSFALKHDGVSGDKDDDNVKFHPECWEVRDGALLGYITPGECNKVESTNSSVEKFRANDPNGFVLTLMAMGIVFSALILLSICFYFFGKLNEKKANRKKAAAIAQHAPNTTSVKGDSGQAIAAIAMALYEHLNAHDKEDTILTINKVKKAYSPWSSKIYTLRETPNLKTW